MLIYKKAHKQILLLLILSSCASVLVFSVRNFYDFYTKPIDYIIFASTYKKFDKTQQLYKRAEEYEKRYSPSAAVYKFPPTFLLGIIPLTKIPRILPVHEITRGLFTLTYLLSVYILCAHIIKLFRLANNRKIIFLTVAITTSCWFMPFFESIRWILFEIPFLLIFISSYLFLENRKLPALISGIFLGYIATAKIYPLFMLGPALYKKNILMLTGAAIGIICSIVVSLSIFGVAEHVFYLEKILPVISNEPVIEKSINLNPEKFLFATGVIPEINGAIFQLIRSGFLLALLWILWRYKDVFKNHVIYLFSLFITTMFFCFPNYWPQYQIYLIFPYLTLLAAYLSTKNTSHAIVLTLTIAFTFVPDTLWRDVLNWDVELRSMNFEQIAFAAHHKGVGITLFRESKISWLVYYTFECRALIPIVIWFLLVKNIIRLQPLRGTY